MASEGLNNNKLGSARRSRHTPSNIHHPALQTPGTTCVPHSFLGSIFPPTGTLPIQSIPATLGKRERERETKAGFTLSNSSWSVRKETLGSGYGGVQRRWFSVLEFGIHKRRRSVIKYGERRRELCGDLNCKVTRKCVVIYIKLPSRDSKKLCFPYQYSIFQIGKLYDLRCASLFLQNGPRKSIKLLSACLKRPCL